MLRDGHLNGGPAAAIHSAMTPLRIAKFADLVSFATRARGTLGM